MPKVKFYSLMVNNGDGSAGVLFFADKKTAQAAYDLEEKSGEGFSDNEPILKVLEFDDSGKLLNPDSLPDYY